MHAESGTAQAVATTAPPGCAAPEQEGSRRARQRLMEALIIRVYASTAGAAAIKNLQGFFFDGAQRRMLEQQTRPPALGWRRRSCR